METIIGVISIDRNIDRSIVAWINADMTIETIISESPQTRGVALKDCATEMVNAPEWVEKVTYLNEKLNVCKGDLIFEPAECGSTITHVPGARVTREMSSIGTEIDRMILSAVKRRTAHCGDTKYWHILSHVTNAPNLMLFTDAAIHASLKRLNDRGVVEVSPSCRKIRLPQ